MYIYFTDNNYTFVDRHIEGAIEVIDNPPIYNPMFYKIKRTNARDWVEEDGKLIAQYDIIPLSLSGGKQRLRMAVTAKRWEVMTGGITLPNGIRVDTSVDSQNRIDSIVSNAHLAGLADESEIDFKAEDGWVKITIADLKGITGLIGHHIQRCYSAERMHHEAIDALTTVEQLDGYDINTGWEPEEP